MLDLILLAICLFLMALLCIYTMKEAIEDGDILMFIWCLICLLFITVVLYFTVSAILGMNNSSCSENVTVIPIPVPVG